MSVEQDDVSHWGRRYTTAMGITATGVAEIPDPQVLAGITAFRGAAKNSCIMDAGCGPGRYAKSLLDNLPEGGSLLAVDGVADVVGAVRERFRGQGVFGEVVDLNDPKMITTLSNYPIGGVLCADVLSVVKTPLALLQNLHTVTISGGLVVLTFQTTQDETMKDGPEIPSDLPGTVVKATTDKTTFRFFEVEAARQLIKNCGYTILEWNLFERREPPHVGREYEHTHVEVCATLQVEK